MGCDIHLYVEHKVDGIWQPADKWKPSEYEDDRAQLEVDYNDAFYTGRNYDLFAILANVRNGVGFAGMGTGNGFKPICLPRGLPGDVTAPVKACSDSWGSDGHSHSYQTLAELLTYDWTQTTRHTGWVDVLTYGDMLQTGAKRPKEWSGGVGGQDVKHVSAEAMAALIKKLKGDHRWWDVRTEVAKQLSSYYTQVEWTEPYYESTAHFWATTMPRLLALAKGDYESVRIVYWFDN